MQTYLSRVWARAWARAWGLVFALAFLSPLWITLGCVGAGWGNSKEDFLRIVREFNDDLRWGRQEMAIPRVVEDKRAQFQERLSVLGDQIEIVDYDIINLELPAKGQKAKARISVSWIDRQSGTVQQTQILQHWEDRKLGWYLITAERLRGAPMALAEEPAPVKKPAASTPPAQ